MLAQSKTEARSSQKPIYVVSDLHIGNGSAKDSLVKGGKSVLFEQFLDTVEQSDGRLVICGDLFELWRYRLEDVLDYWHNLIERLAAMDVIYVPGNHDPLLDKSYQAALTWHPLFEKLSEPFTQVIGQKRFMFMHGHEIDPIIAEPVKRWAPMLRLLTGAFELGSDCCLMTSDRVTDFLLETGEQFLRIWQMLTRRVEQAVDETLFPLSGEKLTRLKQPLRTRNMLSRFYRQQQEGVYDITITGHTHNAGRFGQWYFNSGCWTRPTVSYLHITPDGEVSVRDWTEDGARCNPTVVSV